MSESVTVMDQDGATNKANDNGVSNDVDLREDDFVVAHCADTKPNRLTFAPGRQLGCNVLVKREIGLLHLHCSLVDTNNITTA